MLIEMCGAPSSDQVCALNPSTANGLYATGCLDAVEESIVANAKIVGGIACGVILLMVREGERFRKSRQKEFQSSFKILFRY